MNKKTIDINNINLEEAFLHYTGKSNIESIFQKGLEPRIGINSKGIEQTEKVFFTIGDKNTLILMDAWLKWLILKPNNNQVYVIGAYLMTKSWFPKSIIDMIFKTWIKSNNRKKRACKKLDKILDNSVFLKLNLEENIDFDYLDTDEVKQKNFSKDHLKYVYSYNYDLEDSRMEAWNMHTYSSKTIEVEKLALLKIENSYSANDIIKYMAKKHIKYIEKNCKFLYYYLNKSNGIEKE